MVLRRLTLVAHARRHTVHVHLANHRLVRRRRQLVHMRGNKSAIGQRQPQKTRDFALRRHPLQKALVRHRRLVRHALVKGQLA